MDARVIRDIKVDGRLCAHVYMYTYKLQSAESLEARVFSALARYRAGISGVRAAGGRGWPPFVDGLRPPPRARKQSPGSRAGSTEPGTFTTVTSYTTDFVS